MTGRAFHSAPGRENARDHVEYARVTVSLAQRTDKAILIGHEKLAGVQWIPLRDLDLSSRITVAKAVLKSDISIGIDFRKAAQMGLL